MTGFKVPAGSSGAAIEKKDLSENEKKDQQTILDSIIQFPGKVAQAFTGEGVEIEYPNVPEATEISDMGFFESIAPNVKMMMVRDDDGKAEIIQNTFKDDKRFGGVFSDKFDNPMVVWNDKAFYINKPGFSTQDFGTAIGEIIKFLPASKYAGAGKSIGGKLKRGAMVYPPTELASQAIESTLAPKTTEAKDKSATDLTQDVALSTGLGMATDVLAGPIGKGIKTGVTAVGKKVGKSMFPRYKPSSDVVATATDSPYNLTKGQAEWQAKVKTGTVPQSGTISAKATKSLQEEDVMRHTKGEGAGIIQGADEVQLSQIRGDADTLTKKYGSGGADGVPKEQVPISSVEKIKTIVSEQAETLKTSSKELYDEVRQGVGNVAVTREGVIDIVNRALSTFDEMGIGPRELAKYPSLSGEIKYLKRIQKLANNPRFKTQPFKLLQDYQKVINRAVRTAEAGSPEQVALGKIKSVIDNSVKNGIDNAFIVGDEKVINNLLQATDDYKRYIGITGKGVGKDSTERAANGILQKLTSPDLDADAVVNKFFGHAKFNPAPTMRLVLQKLKDNIPADEFDEVLALVKDGVLTKAFSGTGKSGVTRTNIVNNYNQVFNKNKKLIEMLFQPEEIAKIKQFRENVMPTLWAEIKLNPSNSGYTVLGAFARAGLLNFGRMIPVLGATTTDPSSYQGILQTRRAVQMVDGYLERKNFPLFNATVQGALRPTLVNENVPDSEMSYDSLNKLIASIKPEAKDKLLNMIEAK